MTSLNLQRNSEVFFSTVDLINGAAFTSMTPSNTWKLEVLEGFALTSSAATQDITSLESGTAPDRSQQRFNTALNPAEWNFQVYMRPTKAVDTGAADSDATGTSRTGNTKPVADWFMWQALVSNTIVSDGTAEQSVWVDGGKLKNSNVAKADYSHASYSNFPTAGQYQLYFKLDNVVYQVSNTVVNQATVDAGIEQIATTTWTGMGSTLRELSATPRDSAISVFGGILNDGSTVVANSNVYLSTAPASFQPFNQMNIAGVISTHQFIKNRLSKIELHHQPSAGGADIAYTFPITAMSIDYTNNITYLTPEELSALNEPIGQFTGAKGISGSMTMYLRAGSTQSSEFLRNITNDSRTSSASTSNANIIVGGTDGPYVAFQMDAVHFEFPQLSTEEIISMSVGFLAQEPTATKGDGGELTLCVGGA